MLRAVLVSCVLGALTVPASAAAQDAARDLPDICTADTQESEGDHVRLQGGVECTLPDGGRVFGAVIRVFTEQDARRIVAEGNVVFSGPDGHIWADRLDYNTATGTGTFENAYGLLSLPNADPVQFGGQAPQVEFDGKRLEKLGPGRYRLTEGSWTTCTQPTPRWAFTSGRITLELDRYVIATHTVFRVKGVPVAYLPWFYYPIQEDGRATGFLMPTLGASTFRGQAVSNGFFWAIGRSHDATFVHDWFTKAGQAAGVEYRYVTSPDSSGTIRFYRFARRATSFTQDGNTTTLAGSNSFELTGSAVQTIAPGVIARARLDYISDVINQQLLYQNLFDASRRSRMLEGSLSGTRGPWSGNVLYQRTEVINGIDDTLLYGSAPRINATLAPQRLFRSPVYGSFNTEYAYLPFQRTVEGVLMQDDSFSRFDASPSIRVPLSRLSFLSINTSAGYRATHYSRRGTGTPGQTTDGSFLRQYGTMRTEVVGPVFSRIFDVEDSTFAERLKHVIEPAVTVDLTSPIRDYRQTPLQSDVSDFVVGGSSRLTYGVTSRLFFRKPMMGETRGETREFVTVGLQQTSYSNAESSRYDTTYSSAVGTGGGRTLSPVALTARVSPSNSFDGNMRAEYDPTRGLQTLTTGAGINYASGGMTLNFSRQRFDRSQPANSFLSATTRTQLLENRVTASYAISWDISRSYVVSQGIIGSYMAQCCGIQGEFQQFNYPSGFGLPINADRRINFSFVLAGLGTFSNFFGAFGGG